MTDHAKPTIPDVLPRLRAYVEQEGNWAGGSLHIVIDDGNITDSDVAYCREWSRRRGDAEGEALAEILLRMSLTQRRKLATLVWLRAAQ